MIPHLQGEGTASQGQDLRADAFFTSWQLLSSSVEVEEVLLLLGNVDRLFRFLHRRLIRSATPAGSDVYSLGPLCLLKPWQLQEVRMLSWYQGHLNTLFLTKSIALLTAILGNYGTFLRRDTLERGLLSARAEDRFVESVTSNLRCRFGLAFGSEGGLVEIFASTEQLASLERALVAKGLNPPSRVGSD